MTTHTQGEHAQTEALAHELFAAAQLAPGEGIEDAVSRIAAALTAATAQPAAPQGVAYAELPVAFGDGVLTSTRKHELWALAAAGCSDEQTSQKNLIWQIGEFAQLVEREAESNGQAPAHPCAKCGDDKAQHNGARCVNGSENSYFTPTAQAAPAAGAVAEPDEDDSLMLCASDLEHSAIYDNHVEMQSCIRAVAARVRSLAAAPTPAAQADSQPSSFGSPELQAMILARCGEKDKADSVLEDAARPTVIPVPGGAELHFEPYAIGSPQTFWRLRRDGVHIRWLKEYEQGFVNAAIDAARKQGGKHDNH